MFVTNEKIVLASASPRRRVYLEEMGIDFDTAVARIDETPLQHEPPCAYVARMARGKFEVIAKQNSGRWIVSADTIVFLNTAIFGKPADPEDALHILLTLRGKRHRVATAFILGCLEKNICHREIVETQVRFTDFSEETARAYVATGEPLDKAGAYGIQGRGAFLVKEIEGSYSNVVGLPLCEILAVLSKYGIVKTK